jgi:hypothetical protein
MAGIDPRPLAARGMRFARGWLKIPARAKTQPTGLPRPARHPFPGLRGILIALSIFLLIFATFWGLVLWALFTVIRWFLR